MGIAEISFNNDYLSIICLLYYFLCIALLAYALFMDTTEIKSIRQHIFSIFINFLIIIIYCYFIIKSGVQNVIYTYALYSLIKIGYLLDLIGINSMKLVPKGINPFRAMPKHTFSNIILKIIQLLSFKQGEVYNRVYTKMASNNIMLAGIINLNSPSPTDTTPMDIDRSSSNSTPTPMNIDNDSSNNTSIPVIDNPINMSFGDQNYKIPSPKRGGVCPDLMDPIPVRSKPPVPATSRASIPAGSRLPIHNVISPFNNKNNIDYTFPVYGNLYFHKSLVDSRPPITNLFEDVTDYRSPGIFRDNSRASSYCHFDYRIGANEIKALGHVLIELREVHIAQGGERTQRNPRLTNYWNKSFTPRTQDVFIQYLVRGRERLNPTLTVTQAYEAFFSLQTNKNFTMRPGKIHITPELTNDMIGLKIYDTKKNNINHYIYTL